MDVFSLGVVLLQIVTGCPSQLQLGTRFKCTMKDGSTFLDQPFFGLYNFGNNEANLVNKIIKL